MKTMSKENNRIFIMWFFAFIIATIVQYFGNARIPEMRNWGIIIIIFMGLAVLFDFLGENVVNKK